ncbi:hypothetical protein FDECE_4594 [Fusarium decemcellulare]|nr:hypothetical protein FDECE_4594 [Fusarium decemcellulare]
MKLSLTMLGLVAAAAGAALPDDKLPLPLGQVGWEGRVTPDGPIEEYWGDDFDEIEAKIQKDHPGFSIYSDIDPELLEPTSADESESPAVAVTRTLEKRNLNCQARFGTVNPFNVNGGINNLRRITAGCKARARHCIRTQCVGDAGIGLCNDNHHDINIPCPRIADMATEIRGGCYRSDVCCRPAPRGCEECNARTSGQKFDGNHNVIVGACSFFAPGERPV